MRRVLCISPQFPPMNAADMQRLRQALPYLRELGWQPTVVAVDPHACEGSRDPLLLETVPDSVEVIHCGAFSPRLTRKVGLGNLGFRSWPQLRRTVHRYLSRNQINLIFFTTTVFTAIAHGPAWKRRHGVPFVVDLQDPWRNDYYLSLHKSQRPPKFAFDHWQKTHLEAATMPHAGGLVAVSQSYIDTMRARYPALADKPALELPFGVLPGDLDVARRLPAEPPRDPGTVTLRYVGRGGPDMARAAQILFSALREGRVAQPQLYGRLQLEFLGTSYADAGLGLSTIRPIAEREGVADAVIESPDRLPYFQALRRLLDADGLVVLGSDDPSYTASKLYPYLMANRPLLPILHAQSPAVPFLEASKCGPLVTFDSSSDTKETVSRARELLGWLAARPEPLALDASLLEEYGARAMTARLARFFDEVTYRETGKLAA